MGDNGGGSHFDALKNTVRKKRSLIPRRPRTEGFNLFIPSDDIPAFDTNPRRKEFSLSHCISRPDSQTGNNDSLQREATDFGERKRMKLKIGGVSRLAHANGSPRKSSKPVNATTNNHLEESSADCNSPLDKKADLEKDESMTGRRKQGEPGGSVRKSKRALKKQVSDSDEDIDNEIRFLETLKVKPSGVTIGGSSASEKASDDMDAEELDPVPDGIEIGNEIKRESTMTSRQRALASASGKSTAVEFPDGLPPTSRRKRENLSEMEQQVKKAEAAQRRKVQVEKAARESEAEAIRKILGQDSSRKKREDKIKKRLDEIAQEKAAHEERVSTSYIRTIMGPNGTTVSFPIDKVPSLFDPKPSGYPPPRENCAGPSCTNPYRYRDSKTKVPLCSLQCYKAVQEQQQQQQQQQTSERATDPTPPPEQTSEPATDPTPPPV
ncbi:PREDICTED: uncharacterized protein LOC106328665 isoform X1 [Brassica oleracea var. oleracea]|uniref:INO80 complex subunit B-like conserved region domain-containing protein n=1 Tax=Brassica oleracea var. oleracea TaxID=109376 RepID=A0A0D3B740_BRAOL|nr:PREDICTED: uncharacterized protein LOC106328665 isoform X1 [Brassica oleracea var. oleracea]